MLVQWLCLFSIALRSTVRVHVLCNVPSNFSEPHRTGRPPVFWVFPGFQLVFPFQDWFCVRAVIGVVRIGEGAGSQLDRSNQPV